MHKVLLVLLFFLSSCGYQPVYLNKNLKNIEYSKIKLNGDESINKIIINALPISVNDNNEKKNQLNLSSLYKIEPASKNSKGQVLSFKSMIEVNLEVRNINNEIVQNKNFVKQFIYNNKQNNFELVDYQNSIKDDLIDIIINEIIIYLVS